MYDGTLMKIISFGMHGWVIGKATLDAHPGGPEALSESSRCNDIVADIHFLRFFGMAIKCEIAWRFPRSVVKVGLHVQCKNISISSGVQS